MGKKLLVADDSVTIQKVIKLALSSEGYDILAVSDGKEAVRAIEEELPDVVLIDVALPIHDACEIKKIINENPLLAHVGFILMASAFEKIDEKKVGEVRFDGRLIKPFDPSHLRKAVSDLLKKKASEPVSPPSPPQEVSKAFDPSILNNEVSSFDLSPVTADLPVLEESEVVVDDDISIDEKTDDNFTSGLEEKKQVFTGIPIQPLDDIQPSKPIDLSSTSYPEDEESPVQVQTGLESDIRDLTESTIKMSGLEEFEWSLDDSKKMKSQVAQATHAAQVSQQSASDQIIDDGGSNFPITKLAEIPRAKLTDKVKKMDTVAAGEPEATPQNFSRADLEELIKKDLHAAIERLAKEAIPQIAESIIRKEIDKILADPN